MSQSSGSEPDRNPDVDKKAEEEEEQRRREEAEKAASLQVKKVSPIKKFFSSIRVKFLSVIIFFALAAAVGISLTATYMILYFYEDMDTLAMKERVQNAVIGIQRAGNTLKSRGMYGAMYAFMGLSPYYAQHRELPDPETCEQLMARNLHEDDDAVNSLLGMGERSYSVPLQLVMAWDADWNERLVYYHACDDEKGTDHCDRIPREKVFVDYEHGDYRLDQAIKDKVPSFFRNFTQLKPTACDENSCVGIAADIKPEEGGPMYYILSDAEMMGMIMTMGIYPSPPNPLVGWHYLVAFTMRMLQQVQANRTGLCVSGFSSEETDLPDFVKEELQKKKERKLCLNPNDVAPGSRIIIQDTDQVTLDQEYYAFENKDVPQTGRSFCDPSYDHSGKIATSFAYLAYSGMNISTGNLTNDTLYMVRFDYHDPLTANMFPTVTYFILALVIVWFLCIIGMILYFNQSFLVPLDRMRNLRADFIKTILKGLDDDGVLAQEVFGDMLDDSALIEANGDEISVMHTLQNRVDALYSRVIQNRQGDLTRLRNHTLRDLNALKLMSFFLRRDDENLRSVLPGLMDSNEMARRFRRIDPQDKSDGAHEIVTARHAFRSLKAILNNHIATEFFKTFCIQRGRSSVNSFFFLMDVSWLTQVEGAVRNESEDFLTSLFAESVPQSPASMSPLSSPRQRPMEDSMNLSSDLLPAAQNSSSDVKLPSAPATPRRSHFAKKDGSSPAVSPRAGSLPGSANPDSASQSSSTELLGSPRAAVNGGSPKPQRTQFLSKNGEAIAQFIHERYFGRKSLARADPKHAALLGCSQIPDYLSLRDKTSISYSPTMYNNLVAAVTKKFASDVIPQFLNSPTFQMMTYCLVLSGYFEKGEKADRNKGKSLLVVLDPEQDRIKADANGSGFENPVIHVVWAACKGDKKDEKVAKKKEEEDDDDDDDSSSDDSSDDDSDKKKESEDDE